MAALVANIGPQPAGPRATGTGGEHGHRRVVGVQRAACHHMTFERIDQRVEQRGRTPDPLGQGRAGEVCTAAGGEGTQVTDQQLLRDLRNATEDDVARALDGADVELPITDTAAALELFQQMLDALTFPRGEDE